MIFWGNIWSPICGHYFWDNHNGAKKFCEQLGCYSGAMVWPLHGHDHHHGDYDYGHHGHHGDIPEGYVKHRKYSVDAFRTGKCRHNDTWKGCMGGCNDYKIGGSCYENAVAKCKAGQDVRIIITCTCTCTKSSSCRGNQEHDFM